MKALLGILLTFNGTAMIVGAYCFLSLPKRLRRDHPEIWRELGRPNAKSLFLEQSYSGLSKRQQKVFSFAKSGRARALNDPAVAWRCDGLVYCFQAFWASVALMIALIAYVTVMR